MQAGDGIVGKERVRPANQCQMMPHVLSGFAEVHGSDLITSGNPLIQRCENAEAELTRQGGLSDQQQRARCRRIHVGVGQ